MKYSFMQAHEKEFSIERMSCVFKVSRSGYYRFISATPSARRIENMRLLEEIKAIHHGSRQVYGSPRIHAQLQFFHTLKTEHIYFESYVTREQAKQSIFEYVEIFYNRKRSHSTLGYLSPMVFEKKWYQQQNVFLPSVH